LSSPERRTGRRDAGTGAAAPAEARVRLPYITGVGAFLPNAPVDNEGIEPILGSLNGTPSRIRKRILRNNGIRTRHYAVDPATGRPTHTNAR
jgi:3-oxoacyl-[acyl-carrier-protein] synthase-3